jgi:hypothetical protein
MNKSINASLAAAAMMGESLVNHPALFDQIFHGDLGGWGAPSDWGYDPRIRQVPQTPDLRPKDDEYYIKRAQERRDRKAAKKA